MHLKLMIPYAGQVDAADLRLRDLAEFLGIQCELVSLDPYGQHFRDFIERTVSDQRFCLVVNPRVLEQWVGGNELPAEVINYFLLRFPHLLVHAVRIHAFDSRLISALSEGQLHAVETIDGAGLDYEIHKETEDICGAFAGLRFGPANPPNDHVFAIIDGESSLRTLISIGGRPFMACTKMDATEILFLACENLVDLESTADDKPLSAYFSQLVPQAMALRQIFSAECWKPNASHACVIIDDPLLRKNYGFLNFECLFRLVEEHNFHTCIAFIPYNYRRNSPQVVDLFRNNSKRLSICYHGSDHTDAELASVEPVRLNAMLRIAETRMGRLEAQTGLVCDKIMVFPQGAFSLEAMRVLKTRNFISAVNTGPHPLGQSSSLTIGEFMQPALLRHAGFPLFLRRYVKEIQPQDIAFNLFFGKPVLIVEHHEIFEHPELLVDVVQKVNSMAPGIRWSGLQDAVAGSFLKRKAPDGTQKVRAYASEVRISNDSSHPEGVMIEWDGPGVPSAVESVLSAGKPCPAPEFYDRGVRVTVELPPHSSRTFSLTHHHAESDVDSLGLRWNVKAFTRRRLSELRDNHLSRNPRLLSVARSLQERYLG
jgi:hypothetical protein